MIFSDRAAVGPLNIDAPAARTVLRLIGMAALRMAFLLIANMGSCAVQRKPTNVGHDVHF